MTHRLRTATAATLLAIVTSSACSQAEDPPITDGPPPVPALDPDVVARGADIYTRSCAACHGGDLSGQENWRTANPDGSYPAPPHDSSGHTWHHTDQLLFEIIDVGLDLPISRMPAFGDHLDDDEIVAVVDFIKSHWGDAERAVQWELTWRESRLDTR